MAMITVVHGNDSGNIKGDDKSDFKFDDDDDDDDENNAGYGADDIVP